MSAYNEDHKPLIVSNLYKAFAPSLSSIFSPMRNKEQKPFVAVDHISFELNSGEILGLLGSNGAGKTTTIQMLLGTMTPTSGDIVYFGKELQANRSDILQYVSFASTYVRLPGRLTIYENLDFYAKLYRLPHAVRIERIARLLKFFDLWHMKDRKASGLSAGETTRAILAKAFLPQPKIVLLDEPTASLDPDIAYEVRAFVLEQRREHNVSILFTSHNMDEVTQVCDRVLIMRRGTIVAHDTPSQLAARVSKTRVQLVSDNLQGLAQYAEHQSISTKIVERSIILEIDEHAIADFLAGITKQGLTYTQISIDKPTLEDYFLQIAQRKEKP